MFRKRNGHNKSSNEHDFYIYIYIYTSFSDCYCHEFSYIKYGCFVFLKGRSEKNGYMTIAGLARAAEKDILRAYDAVRHAPKHRYIQHFYTKS